VNGNLLDYTYGPPYSVSNNCGWFYTVIIIHSQHLLIHYHRTGLFSIPPRWLIPETVPTKVVERSMLHASLLLHIFLAFIIQLAGIGSAVVSFLISVGLGIGIAVGIMTDFMSGDLGKGKRVPAIVSVQSFSIFASLLNLPKPRLTSSALYCHLRMEFNWLQERWTSSFP